MLACEEKKSGKGAIIYALTTYNTTDIGRRKRWQKSVQCVLGLVDKDSARNGKTGCDTSELCYHHKSSFEGKSVSK